MNTDSTIYSQRVFAIINLYRFPIDSFLDKSLKKFQSRPMRELNYTLYTMRDSKLTHLNKLEIRLVEIDSNSSFNNFLGLLLFFSSAIKLESLLIWIKEKLGEYQGRISLIDISKANPLEMYIETKFLGEVQERVRSSKEFIKIFRLEGQNKEEFDSLISYLVE
ncbi:MAG: hypothetical protein HeimC3_37480 [Candidatus Heimdallarchaeota archaeon LC_3]|nr:MAG: hypothetical protein HeimC3_37480 [Candidatus Heimdallarchaeota archaeon LC_3]